MVLFILIHTLNQQHDGANQTEFLQHQQQKPRKLLCGAFSMHFTTS